MNEPVSDVNVIVRLSLNEWQELLEMYTDKNSLLKHIISATHYFNSVLICINKNDINDMLNNLGDLLVKTGFDENYYPNKKGKIIESVIDGLTNTFTKRSSR